MNFVICIPVTTSTNMFCICCCQQFRILGSNYCNSCSRERQNMVHVPKCINCGINSRRIAFEFCSNECGWEYRTRPTINSSYETRNIVSSAYHAREAIQNEYNSRQFTFPGYNTYNHHFNGR